MEGVEEVKKERAAVDVEMNGGEGRVDTAWTRRCHEQRERLTWFLQATSERWRCVNV